MWSRNENVGSEKLFLYLFLPVVSTIGSINFFSPIPLLIFVFLNVCNSYNRSLLNMYVVAYKTSSNTENVY